MGARTFGGLEHLGAFRLSWKSLFDDQTSILTDISLIKQSKDSLSARSLTGRDGWTDEKSTRDGEGERFCSFGISKERFKKKHGLGNCSVES